MKPFILILLIYDVVDTDRKFLSFYWEKNRKTFFDFLSSGLGINVSFFRLGQFEEVGSELGSPEAGVEIGTG